MRAIVFPVIVAGLTLSACAGMPHDKPSAGLTTTRPHNPDPLESFNRQNFYVNGWLDRHIIRPLALFSQGITPGVIGKGIHNITSNLKEPVVAFNDLLQLRPGQALRAMTRMAVNSTVGIAGALDVAAKLPIPRHGNGFGDTLGRYGVGPGPYLYLPILGPSDLRDLFGTGVDTMSDPINWAPYTAPSAFVRYIPNVYLTGGFGLVNGLNTRAEADIDLETLLGSATDPYATLRSTYLQLRQGEVDDKHDLPALPDLGDPAAGSDPLAPPPASPPASAPIDPLVGPPAEQPHALLRLPDQQSGEAHADVARPLEQGQGQGKLGTQTEQGPDQSVGALLYPDAHRSQEGGAANGAHETLDR